MCWACPMFMFVAKKKKKNLCIYEVVTACKTEEYKTENLNIKELRNVKI